MYMSTCSPAPTASVTPTAPVMENPPASLDQQQQQQQQQLQVKNALHTCRYPSKKCWNARALKRNGEMHNLCDEHRQKANKNQRRLEQKRKTSKKVVAAKRVRKSRANAKKNKAAVLIATSASANASGLARPAKQQQVKRQQAQATRLSATASGLVAAAKTVYSQAPSSQTFPVHLNTALPSGFFTGLMLSENTLYGKQQQQSLDLNLNLGLMGTMMMPPPHQLQQQHLQQHPRVPSMTDFLDGDLDSLTDCLDFSVPSFVNMGCGLAGSSGGSASPIDVCDGLDAVAAVNDFWWHPVVAVDPLLDTSALVMNEEIFSFHYQH